MLRIIVFKLILIIILIITIKLSFSKCVYKKGAHDDRLVFFVDTHFKFNVNQYGFQKKSSTLGATVDLVEHITSELDQNRS